MAAVGFITLLRTAGVAEDVFVLMCLDVVHKVHRLRLRVLPLRFNFAKFVKRAGPYLFIHIIPFQRLLVLIKQIKAG